MVKNPNMPTATPARGQEQVTRFKPTLRMSAVLQGAVLSHGLQGGNAFQPLFTVFFHAKT